MLPSASMISTEFEARCCGFHAAHMITTKNTTTEPITINRRFPHVIASTSASLRR
jgi:hypothetical protein